MNLKRCLFFKLALIHRALACLYVRIMFFENNLSNVKKISNDRELLQSKSIIQCSNPKSNEAHMQIAAVLLVFRCALLIADLFLFCYEKDFVAFHPYNKEAEIIQAFNLTYRYLDYLLNIDNPILKACWVVFIHLNYS